MTAAGGLGWRRALCGIYRTVFQFHKELLKDKQYIRTRLMLILAQNKRYYAQGRRQSWCAK